MVYELPGDEAHAESGRMPALLPEAQTNRERQEGRRAAARADAGVARRDDEAGAARAHFQRNAGAKAEADLRLRSRRASAVIDLHVVVANAAGDERAGGRRGGDQAVHDRCHTAGDLAVAINGIVRRLRIRAVEANADAVAGKPLRDTSARDPAGLVERVVITHGHQHTGAHAVAQALGRSGRRNRDAKARRGEDCESNAFHFQPPRKKGHTDTPGERWPEDQAKIRTYSWKWCCRSH